jgi:hypothetical protein
MFIRETIAIIDRLPITSEERELIYWRNAAEMLKLQGTEKEDRAPKRQE